MARLSPEVHALLARQHGIVSVSQLREAGHSPNDIRQLQRVGDLESVLRGAYRTPSSPLTEAGRCAAVCLARPDAAIAGPTAGRLWGLRRLPSDKRIHVIAPRASQPAIARWVVPYRTDARHDGDIETRSDGIRVTSRSRTALDLARWLRPDDLLSVIEQVVHDGRVSDTELLTVAVDWMSPRRKWVSDFLRALDRQLPGPAAESHPEVRVGDALRLAGVRGLVRQHNLVLPGHGLARFDLAVPDLRWAIEVDLHPVHREQLGIAADARRDRAAETIGWLTSRISEDAYVHRFRQTIAELVAIGAQLRRGAAS